MTDNDKGGRVWYLRHAGLQTGPFSSAAVRRLLLQGQAELGDEVSEDRKSWNKVAKVPEVVPPDLRAGGDGAAAGRGVVSRPFPWLAILLFTLVIGGAIGFGFWWGGSLPDGEPQCHAEPSAGVNWTSCQLTGLRAAGTILRGALMANADLTAATLAGADLSAAVMDYANLRQSDLGYANLRGASLRGADLRGADFTNADLSGADLSFADLTGAILAGAELRGAIVDQALWVNRQICARGSVGGCVPGVTTP